jgi:hypothetical protein
VKRRVETFSLMQRMPRPGSLTAVEKRKLVAIHTPQDPESTEPQVKGFRSHFRQFFFNHSGRLCRSRSAVAGPGNVP